MFANGTTARFDLHAARIAGERGCVDANTQWWRGNWWRSSAGCSARTSA